ncbi:MAG: hypothetical protein WC003_11270 [Terrimicrobiaceae bacterium]
MFLLSPLKRILIAIGFWADEATHTAAIDEANIQADIKRQNDNALKANKDNGDLQTTIILLKQQIHNGEINAQTLTQQLRDAAAENDEARGADLAERLDRANSELQINTEQMTTLEGLYRQNLDVIANSLRETERLQAEFKTLQAQNKNSKMLEQRAEQIQNSIAQLRQMTDTGQALERMRERAAKGQGRFTATMDLAKKMGANIAQSQKERSARGRALFEQFKAKGTLTNPEVAPATTEAEPKPTERQKISEG